MDDRLGVANSQLGPGWVGNVDMLIKHTRRYDSCLERVKIVK